MSFLKAPHDRHGTGGPTEVGPSRRAFFRWMIGLAASVIGLGLAVPLASYVISPALKRRKSEWAEVGPTDKLQMNAPEELEFDSTVKDGWKTDTARKAIWAVRQSEDKIIVFSPICPHLGCGFRWNSEDHKFHCPCHGSVYAVDGKVLGGPAPRPLDVLPTKVQDGRLWVLYKEFKSGLDHPVEL